MTGSHSFFDIGHRAMSAQMMRMNTAASNLANAGSTAANKDDVYIPMRTVFEQELDRATGLSTVRVGGVVREDVAPQQRYEPGNPNADENGYVWAAPIDESAEMVEMLEASRQYRNMVEAMSTAKQLMLETMRMK